MASSYNELFGLGSHSADADLLAWWNLQETSGTTAADDSGNSADGTFVDFGSGLTTRTGPNNYLASAVDFDRSSPTDYVSLPNFADGLTNLTFGGWMQFDSTTDDFTIFSKASSFNDPVPILFWRDNYGGVNNRNNVLSLLVGKTSGGSHRVESASNTLNDTNWHHVGFNYVVGDSDGARLYIDGARDSADQIGTTGTSGIITNNGITTQLSFNSTSKGLNGGMSSMFAFERTLSGNEWGEVYDGPEPVNTAVPTVSGTAQEGQTLTATSGTWGLDSPFASGSNGTITYSYSWYRADDASGTNRSLISGETAATYTPTFSDVGKFVQVEVRASNLGGFDSDADTASAYTSEIGQSVSGFNAFLALNSTVVLANA